MDRTNFIDFIKDSDSKEAEPHGWQRLLEEEEGEASGYSYDLESFSYYICE
jgi:hypothetical protein